MELCEQASGARMHTALYRPFGFDTTVFTGVFVRELCQFLTRCGRSLAGAFLGLLNNRSFKSRLSYIGQVSLSKVHSYGITGLIARSCGGLYDLRLQSAPGYSLYRELSLRVFLGRRGDNLDRFLIRVKEVSESFRLLSQIIQSIQPAAQTSLAKAVPLAITLTRLKVRFYLSVRSASRADVRTSAYLQAPLHIAAKKHALESPAALVSTAWAPLSLALEPRLAQGKFNSMESLISHFRAASEGWPTRAGFTYNAVESPKGEVGVSLISSGSTKPVRVKLRTPVSHNMHLIPTVAVGATFADFVATFCSLDIVMGEIDR